VNRVQLLEYRTVTIGGIGYYLVKSNKMSLVLVPGFGYGKSQQTPLGRVLSFGAGIPPSIQGAITGLHNMLNLQLTPTLSFQQDLHYFWSLGAGSYRQAQLNAQFLGMMAGFFGLSVMFKLEYDNSMPPPVNRTWWALMWGVQLNF